MSLGGAVAGGSRLAMARRFDPETFWDEARRYGVTVASYTWTQLHGLLEAPPHPNERHHPVRLFIGSGMPRSLWERITERFAPAGILEFWAATAARRRSSPTSAAPSRARWAVRSPVAPRSLSPGTTSAPGACSRAPTGWRCAARPTKRACCWPAPAATGESGPRMLRGVFERGDAWISSESLFSRDADGDHWLIDSLATVIRTAEGYRPLAARHPGARRARTRSTLPSPTASRRRDAESVVSAVTLHRWRRALGDDLDAALGGLAPERRPEVVRVVERIPTSSWYRPLTGELREQGIPKAAPGRPVFRLDHAEGRYGHDR